MFKFITRKPLWVNILVGLGLSVLIIVLFLQSLDWITKHDKTLTIPAVTGKSYSEAVNILEDAGFDVEIQDSIFNDTAKPMMVLRQFPEEEAVVKRNRTVYLTINRSVPPTIEMPKLDGLSYRSAEVAIRQYGLKLKDTIYRSNFAKNSVLEVLVDGKSIKAGTPIAMGTEIVLVLASGVGEEEYNVPDLFGKTLAEAKVYLESYGLILGTPLPQTLADDPNAFVMRQTPEPYTSDGRVNKIRQGQMVDVFLQTEKPVRASDSAVNGSAGGDQRLEDYY